MGLCRFLLLILVLGLLGTAAELVVTEHTENGLQWIPLVLIVAALCAIAWNEAAPGTACRRVLRTVMLLFLASGLTGIALHWRGKMEFQLESDPSLSGWALFRKAMESKTPPALAPGVMIQLGLLGLAYQLAGRTNRKEG